VAIDAKEFYKPQSQFSKNNLLRELNKAYVGFYHPLKTPASGVATGNWGCGAFGGDARLKSLLQLMVCARLERPIAYFTFGDEDLRDEVYEMYEFCKTNHVTVGKKLSNF
jgi:poly(ADP-ribose) glycohydrolase